MAVLTLCRFFADPLDDRTREIADASPIVWIFRAVDGTLVECDDSFRSDDSGRPDRLEQRHPGLRSSDNDAAIVGHIEGFYVCRARLDDGSWHLAWTSVEEMLWHL